MILVSHDRWFVSQLATRIVEISPQGLNDFVGSYEEYVERCGDDHLDTESVLLRVKRERKSASPKAASDNDRSARKRQAELAAERDRITEAIDHAEARVNEINELFCDPTYFERTPHAEVRRLESEQKKLKAEIEDLMGTWQRLEEELEAIEV